MPSIHIAPIPPDSNSKAEVPSAYAYAYAQPQPTIDWDEFIRATCTPAYSPQVPFVSPKKPEV